jgi:hypothetical protein
MTTDNLKNLDDDLDAKLGVLGNEASSRPGEIDKLIKGKQRSMRNKALGAAVLIQRDADEIDDMKEELDQMSQIGARAKRILGVLDEPDDGPAVSSSSVTDPPPGGSVFAPDPPSSGDVDDDAWLDELYTISQLNGMTNARLQQLAEAYGMDHTVYTADRTVVIARIVSAQHNWCIDNGVTDPNGDGPSTAPVAAQPSWQQQLKKVPALVWLIVIVVFVVILAIMSRNYETILGWAGGDAEWQDNGFVHFLLIAVPPFLGAYWAWIIAKSFFDNGS